MKPSPIYHSHRAGFLIMASSAYLLLGLSHVLISPTTSRAAGFGWLPSWLGLERLGWLWIVIALAVAAHTILRPAGSRGERLAWALLTIPPALWSLVYLSAWIMGEHRTGWVAAISYGYWCALALYASGWPDPPRVITTGEEADE